MKRMLSLLLAAALLLLAGCGNATQSDAAMPSIRWVPASTAPAPTADDELLAALDGQATARPVDAAFLAWADANVETGFAAKLLAAIAAGGYADELFFEQFGHSLHALYARYAESEQPNVHVMNEHSGPVRLAFTGDINFADTWENMRVLQTQPGGLEDCLSPPLLARMREADILLVNNEFTYSDGGAPMPGKQYTFRAATQNVEMLHTMGADVVSLANNHVYDYGTEAFYDTLDTLQGAGVPYVGAGRDIDEAMRPQYFVAGGLKFGYVAASRAEKHILTPEATADAPGVLRTYEPELFLQAVQQAKQNADVVIAYPHWGTENTTKLEAVQVDLGRMLVDAGADLVVGAHPHCLQGLDFHNGKPIAYSLGNFWFNTDTVDTALLEVTFSSPQDFEVRVQPCLQAGGKTKLLEEEAARLGILNFLQSLSPDVNIAPDGVVAPRQL